jgi:hypothetical protein
MNTLNAFLKIYDKNKDYSFDSIRYRFGAAFTCPFGLAEGYRIINDQLVWDYVRIHSGVDRSGKYNSRGQPIKNIVVSPFDFDYSEFFDYGVSHTYGSIIRLFNNRFGFIFEILHMNPQSDIDQAFLNKILNNKAIARDELIGRAGTYGTASTSEHTHTNIMSISSNTPIFEELLYLKYQEDFLQEYSLRQVIDFFRTKLYFNNMIDEEILKEFEVLKNKANVGFLNKYKYEYKDWFSNWKIRTRYSSELLFNGV